MDLNATVGELIDKDNAQKIAGNANPNVAEPPKPTEEPGKTPGQPAVVQDEHDYTKDARYGKMWSKESHEHTLKGVYKSYKELEKMKAEKFDPLQKNFDGLIKTLEDRGYSAEKIGEILDEHKTLTDPETEVNKRAVYFDEYLSDPVYREKVIGFMDGLDNERMAARFPNMNAEQIKKQVELEQRLEASEGREKERKFHEDTDNFTKEAVDGIEKAKARSEKSGFAFTEEIKQNVLDHCLKNEIPTKWVFQTFLSLYEDQLNTAYDAKHELSVMEKLQQNKEGVIINGGHTKPAGEKKLSFTEKIGNLIS